MDYGASARLVELLETATQANMRTVEAETLKSLKSMLRESDDNVRRAYELLFFKLKDGSSQVCSPTSAARMPTTWVAALLRAGQACVLA